MSTLLHNKPIFKYCGLTIIMSNPSRFDKIRLLSANGGAMFDNFCLRPELNSMMCDVRVMEDNSSLLPDTKAILIMGEAAMYKYLPETFGSELGAMRGSVFYYKNIPTIPTFLPQDAVDYKNHEATLNPLSKEYSPDDSVSEDDEDEGDVKSFGRTKRSNYSFWIKRDVWKVKQILSGRFQLSKIEGVTERTGEGSVGRKNNSTRYLIYPPSEEVINILSTTKNKLLFFDMETDYEEQNLQCFSFSFGTDVIYCVPILDHTYRPAYSSCHRILRALAIAIRDNVIVSHNGANFDFFVLANKYRIPIVKAYDTMIAMHRCFPDIEKSLGHCVSYWTWEKFHKDEDSRGYNTQQQMMDRMKYCGKDVYTMALVYEAIESYAKTIPGLKKSIDDAMACIRPYLTSTIQGIRVDENKLQEKIKENDRLMVQYNRMIELLIGHDSMVLCRNVIKGKAGMFAGSNKQCCEYFHNLLGYPVMARSKKTNEPSLGKKALYKLALKHNNPVIGLLCMYRTTQLETGRMQFVPLVHTENNKRDTSNWIIAGTKTFRLRSKKIFKKFGGNLQNIEKSLREIYVPDIN